MSSLRKIVLGRGPKRFSGSLHDCTPLSWSKYFDKEEDITVDSNTFHVYYKGEVGPVLVTVHGGGYSGLTWALFAEEITNKIECQVLSVDLRGHGNSKTDNDADLSLETLANDLVKVITSIYGELPPVVLIGHSLGGAIVVEAARHMHIIGMCVIDVVEGTALESLSSMQSILRGRPSSFSTVEQAIQWSTETGNLASGENMTVRNHLNREEKPKMQRLLPQKSADAIEEEPEIEQDEHRSGADLDANSKPPLPNSASGDFKNPTEPKIYAWRIDLSKTEPFWMGWFKGLSQKFLEISAPKVLLLANIHGLDTTLTVGQMQGKFQFQVLPRSGHAIHEDQPQQVADIVAGFLVKQKLAIAQNGFTPILPAC